MDMDVDLLAGRLGQGLCSRGWPSPFLVLPWAQAWGTRTPGYCWAGSLVCAPCSSPPSGPVYNWTPAFP